VRCKRVMNHAVVSVIGGAPAKVRCRTCHSDHDFRHEQAPPPKVDARKAALFQEVLKKVNPDAAAVVDDVAVDDVVGEHDVEIEAEAEGLGEAEVDGAEMAVVEEAPPVLKAEPKSKPKPKAKGKSKK